ncbi:transcriptional regulator [Cryobacterium melibiosiphilum]|uniref:Transcriptional regulator n=1 Tax=Cryobacterium melibiosiphilum TaxID=995039 RepID=A0A3A5MHD0_9MICO|nr:bacterial transcriptional activator domain-containing protein [Cryobacterium melibiosiphilum]RJT88251.1 transcriptional regulator [Cryobacterium melibiosiphilum]
MGAPAWNLTVLGCWQLRRNGQTVDVGARQKRLISVLALLGARSRHVVAGLLWPDSTELQAAGNLRASLFRITHDLPALVRPIDPLQLESAVCVDLHGVRRLIDDITDAAARPDLQLAVAADAAEVLRSADLLPGWYEDWVLREQDRLQQQRVEALEALARHHLDHSDVGPAIGAARAATAIDPLRESAQLILVRGHLAEDNHASALRAYREFRRSLGTELGVEPSPRFAELLGRDLVASESLASDLVGSTPQV